MNIPEIHQTEVGSYQILLTNQLEQLEIVNHWLNALAEHLTLSAQVVFRIDLILAEVVTNIIENAYTDDHLHQIKVELCQSDQRINLQIEDDGIPFNPLENPEVEFPDNLEDAKIGGLGIHLIRSYSDECYYKRKEQKNILDIVLKL